MSATTLDTQDSSVVAGWLAAADRRAKQAGEPAWALEKRRRAAQIAASLAFPRRDEELWRRTDFGALSLEALDPFVVAPRARGVDDLPAALIERLAGEAGNVALIAQCDGDVVLEQPHPALAKQGVIVCSMDRAIREHGDKVKYFTAEVTRRPNNPMQQSRQRTYWTALGTLPAPEQHNTSPDKPAQGLGIESAES